MERLKTAIQEKRPDLQHWVLLLYDNAHMTKEAIQAHGWEVLPHPTYSSDSAPTDFHLFQTLCAEFRLTLMLNCELGWMTFSESKPGDFYKRGIENLVDHWEEVVSNNGEYVID